MGSKHLVDILRDDPGHYAPDVLAELWSRMPERYRTTDLESRGLLDTDMAVFALSKASRSFRIEFAVLGEPMDRELAWCCFHIVELGGRVPVSVVRSLLKWLAAALEDHPDLRGSLMNQSPRAWERAMASALARRSGELPGQNWNLRNIGAFMRRCYRMLWLAYDQRPWWQHEEWNLALNPRIPRRPHEPSQGTSLHFHTIDPLWLRLGLQWWFKVSLETGTLTWTSLRAIRSGIAVFSDWLADRDPAPPWLSDEPPGVRVLMLEFLGHVRTLPARTGPNKGKPLSDLRVNDIATNLEQFYLFMHDNRDSAAQALNEPGWLRLGPEHAKLWRRGETRRTPVTPGRREVIDDAALSQIMANLHLIGAPIQDGGFGDEQAMRIVMLVARTGRRNSEIRMLDHRPLLPLDRITDPNADHSDGFVAKLRYQQTKIDGAPDTMLVDAEIAAIIEEQQRWVAQHLADRWALGTTPTYLFLAAKMNRHADKHYPYERINAILNELAGRLEIRDSTGRLVDFNRTHRFRHTKATSLLNAGVPLHVVQRYMGHLTPTMTMEYAETLASTHEREFLRYKKITADGRDLHLDPRDLYDMLELDKRTDRILPNGWCLLPPRQSCDKGNACLTCDKFTTDATFLPELKIQQTRTDQLITDRQRAFKARTGKEMEPENIWLAGRLQEREALDRIIDVIDRAADTSSTRQAVRGAGVTARTDTIAAHPQARR
ncbi:tyrosine-type recombinase/integrase [Nocardia farcinica]|uniref:tyrosine-type recombinase/integrase n=1 Tax=Nocardia farcinica TaxID=37329 RepID=UPI001894BFBF|nr:tyrosine-type recombinase/integrase [Nocardia farcinica]MBF6072863.1 tyrosine-type recombinase/integrase [Nocardia farcinica]